jgi:hypothetical protein
MSFFSKTSYILIRKLQACRIRGLHHGFRYLRVCMSRSLNESRDHTTKIAGVYEILNVNESASRLNFNWH